MKLDVLILTWAFTYTHSMCVSAVKVLGILRLSTLNKDQSRMSWPILFLQSNHFCIKSSGCSLIPDQNKLLWLVAFNGIYKKPAYEFLV